MGRHDDLDNHANQLNPNNDAYWQSRGFDGRPGDDWDDDAEDFSSGDSDDGPSAKSRRRMLRAVLLVGGVASSGVAAAMMLPLAKRLKNRLGR